MLLSVRPLKDVGGVNVFRPAERFYLTVGDAPYLYFQLIDKSLDLAEEGFKPPYRRYAPAVSATLQVTLESIDTDKVLVRYATQPYTQDPSIWRLALLSSDILRGTVVMKVKLVEGAATVYGVLQPALEVVSAE